MVSGETKNPEPRPDGVSTVTTAGEARPTRSSSDAGEGASSSDGPAASGAIGGGDAGSATVSAEGCAAGTPGLGDGVTVLTVGGGAGRGCINHHMPPAATTATATTVRTIAAPFVSVSEAESPSTTGVLVGW